MQNKNNNNKMLKKMPEEFQFVLHRLSLDGSGKDGETRYNVLKTLLQRYIGKMTQAGMGNQTFCHFLNTSQNPTFLKNLLKIYGISENQLIKGFYKLGFDKKLNPNPVYTCTYYQSLILAYWLGLENGDKDLRFFAMVLIISRVFNGRLKKYFPNGPNGCDEEIANYILNNKLNNNSMFKKYRSPTLLVLQYLAPQLDDKYGPEIIKDPLNEKKGLKLLITQSYNRVNQMFKSAATHYYQAYQDGKRESLNSTLHTFDDGNKVEKYEGFDSLVDKLSDKISKGLIFRSKELNDKNKSILKEKFSISEKVYKDIVNFLHSDDDTEIVKEYYEYLLKALKRTEIDELCNTHILYTTNELVGSKGRDKGIVNLKEKTDNLIKNIFNKIKFTQQLNTQLIKLRKIFIALSILKLKEQLCNKQKEHYLE